MIEIFCPMFTELAYEIDPKDYVLKPMSFALIIKRNLSSGWYKDHPQIEISGRLHSIELNVIAQDYQVIMQILEKNMTEGQNEFKKPKKPRPAVTAEPSKGENGTKSLSPGYDSNPQLSQSV